MNKNYFLGKFNNTGINKVNVEMVKKDWNHLWSISQYGAKFTLVKGIHKDSPIRAFKTQISANQAGELIDDICLKQVLSGIFRKGSTWKKHHE